GDRAAPAAAAAGIPRPGVLPAADLRGGVAGDVRRGRRRREDSRLQPAGEAARGRPGAGPDRDGVGTGVLPARAAGGGNGPRRPAGRAASHTPDLPPPAPHTFPTSAP